MALSIRSIWNFFWPGDAWFLLVLYLHIQVSLFFSGKIVVVIVAQDLHIFQQWFEALVAYTDNMHNWYIYHLKKLHRLLNGWVITLLDDCVLYYQHGTGKNALFALCFLPCLSYNCEHCMIPLLKNPCCFLRNYVSISGATVTTFVLFAVFFFLWSALQTPQLMTLHPSSNFQMRT